MADRKKVIWDLPVRLFHWLLVMLVITSIITDQLEETEYHYWSGLAILGLVLFRIIWGIIGSYYARFTQFLYGPGSIFQYLQGTLIHTAGHNPLGGWSVFVMLLALLTQAVTGLFMTDEVVFDGPWFPAIAEETAGLIGWVHEINAYVIYTMISLHILAIAYYQIIKKHRLIIAMIQGYNKDHPAESRKKPASLWLALLVVLISAGIVIAVVGFAPEPVTLDF